MGCIFRNLGWGSEHEFLDSAIWPGLMLQYKANFSNGSKDKECSVCHLLDDENHRINDCILFKDINLYHSDSKINFVDIYSESITVALKVIEIVLRMWDLGNGKNAMRIW